MTATEKPSVKNSYKQPPTEKQKRLVALMVENGRKKGSEVRAVGDLMIEAGYSQMTATKPSTITRGEAFTALLDEYLPENDVLEAHKGLIKAGTVTNMEVDPNLTDVEIRGQLYEQGIKVISISRKQGKDAKVYFIQPDGNTRRGAIDMAYKLRGSYAPEKQEIAIASVNIVKYTDE